MTCEGSGPRLLICITLLENTCNENIRSQSQKGGEKDEEDTCTLLSKTSISEPIEKNGWLGIFYRKNKTKRKKHISSHPHPHPHHPRYLLVHHPHPRHKR